MILVSPDPSLIGEIEDSTTVGQNFVKLSDPSAIRFTKIAADNTISTRSTTNYMADLSGAAGADFSLNSNKLTSVTDPSGAQDVATKNYYDGASTNHGGWSNLWISGSDFTSTNTNLTDITGFVTGTLTNSTAYEIECVFGIASSSTGGLTLAVHGGGTGDAATWSGTGIALGSTAAGITNIAWSAIDAGTAILASVGTSAIGAAYFKGSAVTRSTGTATLSIQVRKVTSGTATIKIGSRFSWRLRGL